MNNTYGIVKPSLIDVSNDVEIWYHYKPTRNSIDNNFKNFVQYGSPELILTNSLCDIGTSDNRLPGMYNLNLPINTFGKKGIYTIYIKPKEMRCKIADIGILGAFPDVKGIVLDLNTLSGERNKYGSDNLIGYRIEYMDYNGSTLIRQDYSRIITSNNFCEPISQNITTSNVNSKGYRFTETGSLVFITVTPSTSPSFKSNVTPYIGAPNQEIIITNTKFDPIMLEVEVVEHDIETLSIMAEGEQVRNLENGRISTYNFNGEIYKQYEFSTVKNNYNNSNIIEAKINKQGSIDFSVDLNEIKKI